MAQPKHVLAFMAHPDDIEFLAAGTLIRLKNAGCKISLATATSGDCGTMDHALDEISRIRYKEARAAAKLLDADYYNAACQDLFITYDPPSLRRFTEILRKANPDIVITASPTDYMLDHEITSSLVRSACFAKPMPNVQTLDPEPAGAQPGVPHLYYADPIEGKDIFGNEIMPSFIIDITDHINLKEKMLCCHESQRKWLRDHHKIDQYVITMRDWSAHRGKQIAVQYGEGFRQHLGHGYPQDNILETLGLKCIPPTATS